MNLLILGGSNDAFRLAESLHKKGLSIVYSLAGLVRTPTVEYKVITGGFSQYGGLSNYISANDIVGILDATHPYADVISNTAREAAIANYIPCWQFDRPVWEKQAEDSWFEYCNWNDLWPMLYDKTSIFITTGQLDQSISNIISEKLTAKVLFRTAIKPVVTSQDRMNWVQAIGPFRLEDEITLMQKYDVDALITKNSGGDATIAKLQAARQLQVPVYLLKRPDIRRFNSDTVDNHYIFSNVTVCEKAVLAYFNDARAERYKQSR